MRLTEAHLLVTELVANVIEGAPGAETFDLSVAADPAGIRVSVTHRYTGPLEEPLRSEGFALLDHLSKNWGRDFDGSRFTVWFLLRTPGTTTISPDVNDDVLFEHMEDDPAAYSDELVRRHRDLATSIAARYQGKGVPEEDLDQIALMALLKAIQRFDANLGELRPYAASTISGEMKRALRDHGWSVRVPRSMQELSLEVSKADEILTQKLGRAPEPEEIAEHLSMSEQEVMQADRARLAYTTRSIDKPGPREEPSLGERLEHVDDRLTRVVQRRPLEAAISKLPRRKRHILDLRFNHDLTQSEIADIVGISQMHVSRLLAQALEELREDLA